MIDIFSNINVEALNEDIRATGGGSGVYTPGLHKVVGVECYFYDNTKFEGTTSQFVFTTEDGSSYTETMRTTPKSNQKEGTADAFNYLQKIAIVTGKTKEFATAIRGMLQSPDVPYTDTFKNEVKAKKLNLFVASKFTIMTHSEISGSANGIYVNQRLVLNQIFRSGDNASVSEVKDDVKDFTSFNYWTENPDIIAEKAIIKYSRDDRFENEPVLQEALKVAQAGTNLTKAVKTKLQEGFTAQEVLRGSTTSNEAAVVVSEPVGVDDPEDLPF